MSTGMSYEPHEHLVTPGRVYPEVWRLAAGGGLGLAVYMAFTLAYFGGAAQLFGSDWVADAFDADKPSQVYLLLGSFVGMLGGALAAGSIHRRGLRDLLGGYRRTLGGFLNALLGLAPIMVLLLVFLFATEDVTLSLPPVVWAVLLPLSVVLLLIQVSAEELVFRGYLQSQLAAMDLPPFLWILIPSILFGLAHYDVATMGDAAPWIVAWAILFGILTADLTARTGTLGPAIALHFANNFTAMVLIGAPDYLSGLSLFHYSFSITDTEAIMARLPLDAVSMGLLYLGIRLRLKV